MNVDTGELQALTEQVGTLSRKVDQLAELAAGRLSKADGNVDLMVRTLAHVLGEVPLPHSPDAAAGPRLHVIDGGQP